MYPKLEQSGSSAQSEAKSVYHHVTSAQHKPVPTSSSCGSALLGLSWDELSQDTSESVILGPRAPHSPSVPSKTPRTTACTPPGLSSLSESRWPQSRRSQSGAALALGDLWRGAKEQGKECTCTHLCQHTSGQTAYALTESTGHRQALNFCFIQWHKANQELMREVSPRVLSMLFHLWK